MYSQFGADHLLAPMVGLAPPHGWSGGPPLPPPLAFGELSPDHPCLSLLARGQRRPRALSGVVSVLGGLGELQLDVVWAQNACVEGSSETGLARPYESKSQDPETRPADQLDNSKHGRPKKEVSRRENP